jgi:hypothetical protein
MIFGFFTLFVALIISAVAAYYSIVGLTAIFSAAVIPIIIMGAALEVGKVTAAVWLKINWSRARWTYKMYLVPAVAFLMVLTSMGIFGFLSKAHSDQSLVSGNVTSKIAIYDEKIKTEKENIEANRKALKQMDEGVDQVLGRSTDEKGADKAVALRRSQQKERARLQNEILQSQKSIQELNDARAPIAAEVRKVEAEVGPIKYIAAMIYGDNPDANLLESAVRWVIILIVAVFDPLALVLILAAQQSLRWARDDKEIAVNDTETNWQERTDELLDTFDKAPDPWVADVGEKPTAEELAEIESVDPHPPGWMFDKREEHTPDEVNKHTEPVVENNTVRELSYLKNSKDFWKKPEGWVSVGPLVAQAETEPVEVKKPRAPRRKKPVVEPVAEVSSPERPGDYVEERVTEGPLEARRAYKAPPPPPPPETANIRKSQLVADNVGATPAKSSFGISFPDNANKGEMYLRVDYLPNRLYKYNGTKWIQVDKSKTDTYSYDEQYIQFLIEKLQSGEYDLDQLSASEQELVAEKLKQITNDKT